jgi:hypothetical protein
MTEELRRHPRYEVETQVIYKVEAPSGALPPRQARGVCSRNLSEGGLLLEAEEYLPPGTRLTLLLIRGKRGVIEGQGDVVWAEDPPPQPWLRHGIRITHMDSSQQVAWELFLQQASREIHRRPLRFEVELPLTCRRKNSSEVWEGCALNVSRGGCLVLLPVRLPMDTVLALEVRTPMQCLTTDARVMRFEEPRADGSIPHGLAFVDLQEEPSLLPALFLLGLF